MAEDKDRKKDLRAYLRTYQKNVEKKGGNVVVGFGKDLPEDYLKMQSQKIDVMSIDTNLGGIPLGGTFTVAGEQSVGKTTFAMVIAAAMQRAGKIVAWVDAEHTFEESWAAKQGVNVGDLLLIQASTLEDALNLTVETLRNNLVDFVIFDSIDAAVARQSMATKKGKERDLDDDDIALKARQFSRFFPRVVHSLRTHNAGLMLIAQYRTSGIGTAFINNFHISSGRARSFYDWMTLKLRKGSKSTWLIDDKTGSIIGFPLYISVEKSKVPSVREGQEMETIFFHNKGFDSDFEKVQYAYKQGLIKKASVQSHIYTATDGTEHKIKYGKELKAINWIIENGLVEDVWKQLTGEE